MQFKFIITSIAILVSALVSRQDNGVIKKESSSPSGFVGKTYLTKTPLVYLVNLPNVNEIDSLIAINSRTVLSTETSRGLEELRNICTGCLDAERLVTPIRIEFLPIGTQLTVIEEYQRYLRIDLFWVEDLHYLLVEDQYGNKAEVSKLGFELDVINQNDDWQPRGEEKKTLEALSYIEKNDSMAVDFCLSDWLDETREVSRFINDFHLENEMHIEDYRGLCTNGTSIVFKSPEAFLTARFFFQEWGLYGDWDYIYGLSEEEIFIETLMNAAYSTNFRSGGYVLLEDGVFSTLSGMPNELSFSFVQDLEVGNFSEGDDLDAVVLLANSYENSLGESESNFTLHFVRNIQSIPIELSFVTIEDKLEKLDLYIKEKTIKLSYTTVKGEKVARYFVLKDSKIIEILNALDFEIEFLGVINCPRSIGGDYFAANVALTNTGTEPFGDSAAHIVDLSIGETLYGPYSNKRRKNVAGQCGAGSYRWLEPGDTHYSAYAVDGEVHKSVLGNHEAKATITLCTSEPERICINRELKFQLPEILE